MKKKWLMICGAGLIVATAAAGIAVTFLRESPVQRFKDILTEDGYIWTEDVCRIENTRENGDITETYSEGYDLSLHTFTSVYLRTDRAGGTADGIEFIYDYAAETVTVRQYRSEAALSAGEPDAVYELDREENFTCVLGEEPDEDTEMQERMIDFKQIPERHFSAAGVTAKDMIR